MRVVDELALDVAFDNIAEAIDHVFHLFLCVCCLLQPALLEIVEGCVNVANVLGSLVAHKGQKVLAHLLVWVIQLILSK